MSDPSTSGSAQPRRSGLVERMLMMALFAFVFVGLGWLVALVALVQLAHVGLRGAPSPPLARFASGLAHLAMQIVAFVCFATEREPFPFGDWPEMTRGIREPEQNGS